MKIIDIYIKIANGEKVPTFKIKGRNFGYKYFMKNGFLYEQKLDYEPEVVSWQIDECWLDLEIEEVEDKEYEDIEELSQECFDHWTQAKKINALIRNQKYILEQLNK